MGNHPTKEFFFWRDKNTAKTEFLNIPEGSEEQRCGWGAGPARAARGELGRSVLTGAEYSWVLGNDRKVEGQPVFPGVGGTGKSRACYVLRLWRLSGIRWGSPVGAGLAEGVPDEESLGRTAHRSSNILQPNGALPLKTDLPGRLIGSREEAGIKNYSRSSRRNA